MTRQIFVLWESTFPLIVYKVFLINELGGGGEAIYESFILSGISFTFCRQD